MVPISVTSVGGADEGVKCSGMAGRLENTMHMDVTVEPDGTEAVTLSR